MSINKPYLSFLLSQLKNFRQKVGITTEQLEEKFILGPGWIDKFESGEILPTLDVITTLLYHIGKSLPDLVANASLDIAVPEIQRQIYPQQEGNDLAIYFKYSKYDSCYILPNASLEQFNEIIKIMRDTLASLVITNTLNPTIASQNENDEIVKVIKTDAIARSFLKAVQLWPHINPSDIWWFIIYRAYCDPFNHPAQYARLDLSQSWKRTGGWALEKILVRHYAPYLEQQGIKLFIPSLNIKKKLLANIKVNDRLEVDKVDVVLTANNGEREIIFGVVHVKASFAERRTDDVPMSKSLIESGYISPLWTMDCKSTPSSKPINKGELGNTIEINGLIRSAKRKDIEDDGYFSACFSYNKNTKPTDSLKDTKSRIYICNFANPDDEFSKFIIEGWHHFQKY